MKTTRWTFLLLPLLCLCLPAWADSIDDYITDRPAFQAAAARAVFGFNGDRSMNLNNLPRLKERIKNHQTIRILRWGDDAIGINGEFDNAMISNLSLTLPRNGSIGGSSTYLYSAGSATLVGWGKSNPLSQAGYYLFANGTGYTNATASYNGIPTTQLTVNYWRSNGFGTLTLSTQSYAAGVYGAKGTVGTIDANNSGAIVAATTNFFIPLSTVIASLSSSGTNIAMIVVGQHNTNLNAGFVYDMWNGANGDWATVFSNAAQSNSMRVFLTNYDAILVSDLGTPQNASVSAENMWASANLPTDLVYLEPPPTTNDLTGSITVVSNFNWIGTTTGRPVVDTGSIFRGAVFGASANLSKLLVYYNADGVHLNAGGTLAGEFASARLGLLPSSLWVYGYQTQFSPVPLTNIMRYQHVSAQQFQPAQNATNSTGYAADTGFYNGEPYYINWVKMAGNAASAAYIDLPFGNGYSTCVSTWNIAWPQATACRMTNEIVTMTHAATRSYSTAPHVWTFTNGINRLTFTNTFADDVSPRNLGYTHQPNTNGNALYLMSAEIEWR